MNEKTYELEEYLASDELALGVMRYLKKQEAATLYQIASHLQVTPSEIAKQLDVLVSRQAIRVIRGLTPTVPAYAITGKGDVLTSKCLRRQEPL